MPAATLAAIENFTDTTSETKTDTIATLALIGLAHREKFDSAHLATQCSTAATAAGELLLADPGTPPPLEVVITRLPAVVDDQVKALVADLNPDYPRLSKPITIATLIAIGLQHVDEFDTAVQTMRAAALRPESLRATAGGFQLDM